MPVRTGERAAGGAAAAAASLSGTGSRGTRRLRLGVVTVRPMMRGRALVASVRQHANGYTPLCTPVQRVNQLVFVNSFSRTSCCCASARLVWCWCWAVGLRRVIAGESARDRPRRRVVRGDGPSLQSLLRSLAAAPFPGPNAIVCQPPLTLNALRGAGIATDPTDAVAGAASARPLATAFHLCT